MKTVESKEEVDKYKDGQLATDPMAKEVLIVSLETKDEYKMYMQEFKRSGKEVTLIGDPKTESPTGASGRMTNFLTP